MKILCCADIHGNKKALKALKEKASGADIVICAGDFTVFEQDIKQVMNDLNHLGKTVLIINGNHEEPKIVEKLTGVFDNLIPLHKRMYEMKDIVFVGFGDSGFSTRDKEFDQYISSVQNDLKGKKIVLVVHDPPYGTKLDFVGTSHSGSKSSRDVIKKYHPVLVVCGHIHENAGIIDQNGKTKMINPGPQGKLITL